jgi:hypothetical protein
MCDAISHTCFLPLRSLPPSAGPTRHRGAKLQHAVAVIPSINWVRRKQQWWEATTKYLLEGAIEKDSGIGTLDVMAKHVRDQPTTNHVAQSPCP